MLTSSSSVLQDNVLRLPNYIDGAFRPPFEAKYIENINPTDGSVVSYVPDSNSQDVDMAVSAAKRALASPEWNFNYVGLKKRSEWLKKLADGIEARLEQFAQAESRDTGKPLPLARSLDIPRAIDNLRYFAEFARHYGSESFPSEAGGFHYTSRRPVGVVGLITPWNLPLYLLTWKVAPALMMGNSIVAKPR
jgi:aminomuconate-semialdehyde/2-hydroxymuconate-6-semialdehyde dehydrogenase